MPFYRSATTLYVTCKTVFTRMPKSQAKDAGKLQHRNISNHQIQITARGCTAPATIIVIGPMSRRDAQNKRSLDQIINSLN